jgi:preprotein translocase subunit SecB
MTDTENEPQGVTPGTPPQVTMLAHFVRDLSFENVGAVEGTAAEGAPEITVQVNLDGKNIGEDRYQVNMKLSAKAVTGEHTRFLVELDYTGIFSISNVPETHVHPMMFIECPRLILPFARRVVSDVTRDGGYPPLMLDNVDFASLYRQKLEQLRQEKAQKEQPN